MKKQILMLAALSLAFVACENGDSKYDKADDVVATFEEAAISPAEPESYFAYTNDTVAFLKSGLYSSKQTVSISEWNGVKYVTVSGAVVSNMTDTVFKDYTTDAYKSAVGGAYAGKNFVVWYEDGWSNNIIKLDTAMVVPGFYVCNTAWVANAIKNGDGMSNDGGLPFGKDDWFKLTIIGSNEGMLTDSVEFYLAKGTSYNEDWAYVDLKKLGKVTAIGFKMSGTKKNSYGCTTPSYFCIDNFGAEEK